ncbi:chloride channel protein [Streptomyces sp. NPDC058739]|uniref:chloride channel protein n=1 Tax=Streptomyces sp. NPDC058739 TaxID=3346618 RepID=UPI0036943DA3
MASEGTGTAAGGGGGAAGPAAPAPPDLRTVLLSRRYLKLLLVCGVLGVPIALACFFFVSFQHQLQHWVWESLPEAVGYDRAPWWWPLPALLLAGLILAPIVTRMPGGGGHVPVHGLGGGRPLGPKDLPGVVLAALATLPLGVVLGPEAPLMALGSGLALLVVQFARRAQEPKATAMLATAGSTAAISTILGGPVVAAVMVVEAAGFGGPQLVAVLLPCLVASGTGALVFTGFGDWTGLSVGALALPNVPPNVKPDAGDFLWGIPVAALVALVVAGAHRIGYGTETWTGRHKARRTVAVAVAAGVCLSAYAVITGRNPQEAALSGQAALGQLAADPQSWSVGALVALVVCKGLAWGISLGALRGGPIFPSVLLGGASAMAFSGLAGLGPTPALALGITAAAAVVTRLPLTSAVLTTLLLGGDAYDQMPLIVISSVVATVVGQLVNPPEPKPQPARG